MVNLCLLQLPTPQIPNGVPCNRTCPCTLRNLHLTVWATAERTASLVPTTGIFDKHLSLLDSCHFVETAYLYQHWPLVCFQPTVNRRDTSHRKLSRLKLKVKQSHYRHGQALRVALGWVYQISRQSVREGGNVLNHTHRPPLPSRKYSWYSFLL